MNSTLSRDYHDIHGILINALQLANDHFKKQKDLPPVQYVKDIPMSDLPEKGIGSMGTLDLFRRKFAAKMSNSAGPRYFGFVTGGSTPAAVAGDWLVGTYDQNACGSNDSIAPQLERQTIHFMKQLFHLDDEYFGSFVSGATMSNFVGLALGRQWVGEQHGVDFSNDGLLGNVPVKIVSATPHSSIFKSLSMLGVGRKSVVKVDTLPDREAIGLDQLEKVLKENHHPLIVVANAGTVNTVDFDDLEAVGKLKSKYNFWLHVDAAFGGFAACSEKFAHLLKGINDADSITIDAHKWLNVPYDAAMQFTRHKNIQLKVFQNSAAYLGDPAQSPDFFHYTPENSRRFRALPAWFTLTAYGKEGYRDIVERNCASAYKFGALINTSDNFRLLSEVRMNVVCFTLKQETLSLDAIREFLDAVRDDGKTFFTPTVYKGVPAIRAAVSNWMTTDADIDVAFEALNRVHEQIRAATYR